MAELQIAAGEVPGGEDEWPFCSRDCCFAIGFYGSVEVNDSAGIFQLWDKKCRRRESVPTKRIRDPMEECNH